MKAYAEPLSVTGQSLRALRESRRVTRHEVGKRTGWGALQVLDLEHFPWVAPAVADRYTAAVEAAATERRMRSVARVPSHQSAEPMTAPTISSRRPMSLGSNTTASAPVSSASR
jgi:hypothetical protein